MTGPAHVDPAVVDMVARAIVRYGEAEEGVVGDVDAAVRRSTAAVQQAVARRRIDLAEAQAALADCLSQPDASCAVESQAVDRARGRLEQAVRAQEMVAAAAARFQPARSRQVTVVQQLVQQGRLHLRRNQSDIEAYLQSSSSGGAGGFAAAGGGSASTSAGAVPSAGGAAGLAVPAGFPGGWAMVPLDRIDVSASTVSGPESFGKGYSPEDLSWAFEALHEVVMPALALGKDGDYFAARDARENRSGTRSYHMTWSQFFGPSDAIRLERGDDGRFRITNGQHRIWVAGRRGESGVPARVDL